MGLSRTSNAPVVIARSSNVHIAAMSALKDDTVILVVQLHSPEHSLADITAEYAFPPSVQGACYSESNSRSFNGVKAVITSLEPQGPATTHRITLQLRGLPTPDQPLRIFVRTSFYDIPNMAPVKEDIAVPAHILGFQHFLRPAPLSEQQFGQSWGGHACERRGELRASVGSTDEYVAKIKALMNMHCVKVIGAEVICAATLPSHGVVLLHARVGPGMLAFIARTQHDAYTLAVATSLAAVMA
eukprot:CAMPEP_0206257896 /NCGR_PEP_ID=MMETSP0047_2-20121206/25605_1 /ASSEMBLY_ACC=CAM_ASM_000192 /TAXON_ID=195065 /ORGANISM="Chroomonas mesostigmatica_cf, Strain CCMP1168" /LENGTH=242 /DNA_ID=CAMNT_0053684553 /DNA_START=1 /DNA_END=729 /DNA_ORIENTATION=+